MSGYDNVEVDDEIINNCEPYDGNLSLAEHDQQCKCDVRTRIWVSWIGRHPGRRFMRCGIEEPLDQCNFFRWFDERFSDHIYKLFRDLRKQNKHLSSEVFAFKMQWERQSGNDYLSMEAELTELRGKLAATEKEAKAAEKLKDLARLSLLVAFGVVCVAMVKKF